MAGSISGLCYSKLRSDLFVTRALQMQFSSPLPLLPTNLRSLNFATWFFMTAVQFLNSPQKFSSFPALTVTNVPSSTSPRATTLKATGRVLFERQWGGRTVHTRCGLPVLTSSPGCSANRPSRVLSARASAVSAW